MPDTLGADRGPRRTEEEQGRSAIVAAGLAISPRTAYRGSPTKDPTEDRVEDPGQAVLEDADPPEVTP